METKRRLGKRHDFPPVERKVFVATPAYDGKVDTDYAMSLAQSSMHAVHQKIGVLAQVMGNGAFIEMARNIFVKTFLQTDCDTLFFIDADLQWESRAFIGLIQSDREVCAGAYRKRQDPEEYPLHYIEDDLAPGVQTEEGGWVKCDRVATGFLCIRRHVLEAMSERAPVVNLHDHGEVPWVFGTRFVEEDGVARFMGEDFTWCDDYKEQFSSPIYVWPDFDFIHGGFKGNWHDFMLKQIQEGGAVNFIKGSSDAA